MLKFVLITMLVNFSLLLSPFPNLHAQPVLKTIEQTKARPGDEIELTLRGDGFRQVKQVDSVLIDRKDVSVLADTIDSDVIMRVWVRIPKEINPGHYTVTVCVSGDTFETCLEPLAPEIEVEYGGIFINDSQVSDIDFGTSVVGSPVSKTFRINNIGTATLTLSYPLLPPGYSLVGLFPDSIEAGNSVLFEVQLDAVSASTFTGKLQFKNNDTDESLFNFQITGRVSATPEIEVFYGVTPLRNGQTVNFRTTTVDSTIRKTFTINNSGTATLILSNPQLTLLPEFRLEGSFPNSVETGSSESFTVQLEVDSIGTFSGTLRFNNNTDEDPFTFQMISVVNAAPTPLVTRPPWWRWWPWAVIIVVIIATVVSVLSRMVRIKPKLDFGSQRIKQSTPIKSGFKFRLKPVFDSGRQDILVEGAFILKEKIGVMPKAETADSLAEPTPSNPDDLELIEGIGPRISGLLQASGITSFSQLAATNPSHLRQILHEAGIWIADPTTWPTQSNLAATGKLHALDTLQKELKGGRCGLCK